MVASYGVRWGTKSIFRFNFVALETLLCFENCSSAHCMLSSWRRFHVFESSHQWFHRTVFFGAPLTFRRGIAMGLCRRCVIYFYVFVSSGLPFDCATYLGRYWMYGDIHCTDFTCISYTFPFLLVTLLLCYLVTLLLYVTVLLCPLLTLSSYF